jgi:hypothetical protein
MPDAWKNSARHLSDEQILLFVEGELSKSDAASARAHLHACAACTDREDRLVASLADLVSLSLEADAQTPPFHAISRAQLQSKMEAHAKRPWLYAFFAGSRRYAVYAGLFVIVMGMLLFLRQRSTPPEGLQFADVVAGGLPNPSLTPGATRQVDLADICPLGDDDLDPTVPASTQQAVFAEYGIAPDSSARDYQVDYLINPQLGGTSDVRNLWPEPYTSTVWNARVKDELEDRLHEMVCARTIDLASAQRDIATDWISAYKKYFHTPKPV